MLVATNPPPAPICKPHASASTAVTACAAPSMLAALAAGTVAAHAPPADATLRSAGREDARARNGDIDTSVHAPSSDCANAASEADWRGAVSDSDGAAERANGASSDADDGAAPTPSDVYANTVNAVMVAACDVVDTARVASAPAEPYDSTAAPGATPEAARPTTATAAVLLLENVASGVTSTGAVKAAPSAVRRAAAPSAAPSKPQPRARSDVRVADSAKESKP